MNKLRQSFKRNKKSPEGQPKKETVSSVFFFFFHAIHIVPHPFRNVKAGHESAEDPTADADKDGYPRTAVAMHHIATSMHTLPSVYHLHSYRTAQV